MKKNLVLLTQKFPFEQGEDFLQKELFYLSPAFQSIYLIPTGVRDFTRTRKLPDNVTIIKVENPASPLEISKAFMKRFSHFFPLFMEELRLSGIKPYGVKYLLYHIPFALKIKETIKKIVHPDQNYLFYSYWMDTNAFALALLKKEHPTCRFFIRSHGGDLYNERHPQGQIPFRKFVYDQVDLIAPVSENGTSYITKLWPVYHHKVKTFFLGVEKQPLGPIGEGNLYRVVSCSSLIPLKRVDKILEVVKKLDIKLEWVHFGGGGAELDLLKNMADHDLSPPNKLIAKGHTDHQDIMSFYRSTPVDLLINLSESEGIPVSIMEAISFGIPVLSNDVGGVGEIVTEQTGILVEVDDQSEFIAQKIDGFFKKGVARSKVVRQRIQDFWDIKFNSERNYQVFLEEIEKFTCRL
jgi:glycosyltransferase involved in cell wall biosynthesis